jgi:predicted NBD/HSP70 family sugar kinase
MFVVGIDIGGTHLRAVLMDERLEAIATRLVKLPLSPSRIDPVRFAAEAVKNIARDKLLAGVGIGLTGVIHPNGKWTSSNIPNLEAVDVTGIFQDAFCGLVIVDNDVRCALRGEVHLGAARLYSDVACITLGTGIGGALLLDGVLRKGHQNSAGELGLGGVYCQSHGMVTLQQFWKSRVPLELTTGAPDPALIYPDSEMLGHLSSALLTLHRTLDLQAVVLGG